jgi:5-methylcytosine-specific restriction endonuclease McrA
MNGEKSRERDRQRYRVDPKRHESVRRAAQRHYEECAVEIREAARARAEKKRAAQVKENDDGNSAMAHETKGLLAAAPQEPKQDVRQWQRNHPGRMRRYAERHAGRELPAGVDYTADDVARKLEEQGGRCAYCRRPFAATGPLRPVVDHVHPLSRGGRNDASNIAVVHRVCNESKGSQPLAKFLARFDRPGFSRETRPSCWITGSAFRLSATLLTSKPEGR